MQRLKGAKAKMEAALNKASPKVVAKPQAVAPKQNAMPQAPAPQPIQPKISTAQESVSQTAY